MESIDSPFKYDTREVLGINIKDPLHLAQCGSHLALVSGSHIIIYDPRTNEQIQFISHLSGKISCIAATKDGKKIAVGESSKGSLISVYNL